MTFSQWHQSGQYFNYKEQYPVFFQEAGQGEPILFLHGFPTASWDWHKIWEPLAQNYHLIAFDFMGFGYSAKPKSYHYSIHDQADLAEALLQHLGIQKPHIFAHDYGDTVGQELMARFIERKEQSRERFDIQSMCYLNGGLFPEQHQARPIQKALISPLGVFLTPFLNKKMLDKNFKQIFGPNTQASPQEIDEFYTLIEHKGGKYIFHKLIRYMAERKQYRDRWVNTLIHPPCPTRLIDGALDPVSGRHLAEYYLKVIPHPDVVILDNIGHYPQTEAPEKVLELYQKFRKKIKL